MGTLFFLFFLSNDKVEKVGERERERKRDNTLYYIYKDVINTLNRMW